MTTLSLDAAGPTMMEIELGPPSPSGLEGVHGWFDNGDLSGTGGNLYLYVDGQEYGSLFFTVNDEGKPEITLGQYDHSIGQWVERATLTRSVSDTMPQEK